MLSELFTSPVLGLFAKDEVGLMFNNKTYCRACIELRMGVKE